MRNWFVFALLGINGDFFTTFIALNLFNKFNGFNKFTELNPHAGFINFYIINFAIMLSYIILQSKCLTHIKINRRFINNITNSNTAKIILTVYVFYAVFGFMGCVAFLNNIFVLLTNL